MKKEEKIISVGVDNVYGLYIALGNVETIRELRDMMENAIKHDSTHTAEVCIELPDITIEMTFDEFIECVKGVNNNAM